MTQKERYLLYVIQRGPDECWPWRGFKNKRGYGTYRVGPKVELAHRYGYSQLKRPLKPGETVDHICHNRSPDCPGGKECPHHECQNPAHWEAVPRPENKRRALEQARRRQLGTSPLPSSGF